MKNEVSPAMAAVIIVVLLAIVGFGGWYFFLRPPVVPAVAVNGMGQPTTAGPGVTPPPGPPK